MSGPWWLGLEPAETSVECRGEHHGVRWEAGALVTPDHADLEGERTLSALGGEACVCAEVVDAWTQHARDLRVLVAGRRGPADRLPAREWGAEDALGYQGWTAYAPMASMPIPEGPHAALTALLSLPGSFPDRLVATVAAAYANDVPSPRLHAALYGRVIAELGAIEVELIGAEATPSLTRERAALPFAWVSTVWARGLTTVLGRFCLSAETADGREWTLLTVGPDFGPPQTVRLLREEPLADGG